MYKKICKEDKNKIKKLISNIPDVHNDFYITQNNLRLSIKENLNITFNNVSKGDKLYYSEKCIIIITGYSDGFERKYLKFLSENEDDLELLLNIFLEDTIEDLYVKISKENEFIVTLINNGFEIYKNRGKELLLLKEGKKDAKNT